MNMGRSPNLRPEIRDFETWWMEICLADTKIQNIHQFQVFPRPQIIRYTTWLSYLVTTKYANCRNRNMTQENVCFAESLAQTSNSHHRFNTFSSNQSQETKEKCLSMKNSKWMK